MAEVTLKKKVTLRKKNDSVAFNFSGKLKVKLFWQSETDLDLCLFFKKKDGEVGGVFSNEYRSKKSDLGTLDNFPYMLHMGDNKEPAPGGEETEQINIASLAEIDTATCAEKDLSPSNRAFHNGRRISVHNIAVGYAPCSTCVIRDIDASNIAACVKSVTFPPSRQDNRNRAATVWAYVAPACNGKSVHPHGGNAGQGN